MQASDTTAELQLLNGIVTQLGKGDVALTDSFRRHATAALLTVQQAVRACDAQQPSKLSESFQKLLYQVLKRSSRYQGQEQVFALQILAACIRACGPVSLLQKAVEWATQLSEALRKAAAAAAAQQQAGAANGASTPQDPAAASLGPTGAVVEACCVAAAELCTRLQQYIELPAVRREFSSVAPKLLQPLLSILDNASMPDSTHAAALLLVAALVRCVPSSLRPSLNNLERLLQQLLQRTAAGAAGSSVSTAGGPTKLQVVAQAAAATALLPAVSGEAAAWSEAARKLMASCHDVLDFLLMGLEGRPVDTQYRSHLGTAAGGQQGQAAAGEGSAGWLAGLPWQQADSQQQQGSVHRRQTVPAMLLSSFCLTALTQLLQQPFAAPVPVPGYSLALLAARLLRFDAGAAVAAGAVPHSSTMFQELLVLQPQLQLAGWQLLQQVVRSCGSQLALQGLLLRLTRQGLRALQVAGPPALQDQPVAVRCCMYETAALLLQATGLAGARGLAAEAMGCVVLEVYGHTAVAAAGGKVAAAGQQRPAKRARKSGGATGGELGQFDPVAAVAAASADEGTRLATATAADLQAQVAVLGVLRGLLAAGGQVLPAEVRAHADAVAYHISSTTAQLAARLGQQPALSAAAAAAAAGTAGGSGDLTALQVAAYEALLASVLVPCSHRPPFLSLAVALFRQGRSSSNAAVAAVCQQAAMQVEVLLHPRATAMGGLRQYSGMEAVPALVKPRFWDAFTPQLPQPAAAAPQAAGQAAAAAGGGAATAGGAAQNGCAAMDVDQPAGLHNGPSAAAGSTLAPNAAGSSMPAGAGAVVMGYPVNGQVPAQEQQQQQQQLVQHTPQMVGQVLPGHNASGAGAGAPGMQPAMQQRQDAAEATNTSQPLHAAPSQAQLASEHQQQQQQQQQQQSFAAWGAPPVQAAGVANQAPPAVAAVKAPPAAPVFEDESSDSEGPLPDIDSGDSSSSSEEDE